MLGVTLAVSGLTILQVLPIALVVAAALPVLYVGLQNPRIALYIYAVSIPFESAFPVSGEVGSVSRAAGLILLVSFLANRWRSIDVSLLPTALIIWTGWVLLSLSWSSSNRVAVLAFSLVQLIAATYIAADLVQEDRQVGFFAALWFSVGASFTAVLGMSGFLGQSMTAAGRAIAFESQSPAHFGAVMVPAIVLAIWMLSVTADNAFFPSTLRWRLIAVLVLMSSTGGLVMSGTRSAWIAALAGSAVLPLLPSNRRATTASRAVAALGLLIAVVLVLASISSEVADLADSRVETALATGGSGRVTIWSVGLGIARDNPLIGVGYGDFESAFNADAVRRPLFESGSHGPIGTARASHSIYIEMAAELGLVGLILWLFFIGHLILGPARFVIPGFAYASLLAFSAQGLFLDVLSRKYFWLVVGIAIGYRLTTAAKPDRITNPLRTSSV